MDLARYVQQIAAVQPRLYAYLCTLISDDNDVDDVLQEINLILWRKIEEFQEGTNFTAWAYKIAYYQVLAYIKYKSRRDKLCFDSELVELLADSLELEHDHFEEELRRLQHCIEKLTDKQRELLRQRYYEEVPLKDLASRLNRTVNGLKCTMYRIRESLRVCLQNYRPVAEEGGGRL